MVLQHVAQRTDAVVVARAAFHAERFGDGDLDLVDMRRAQQGLDEPVGEAEHQDVLNSLLAEEVIDAEDLLLAPVLVQLLIQCERALEVGAERLLDDEPAPPIGLVGQARLRDRLGAAGEHARREREIEDRRAVEHVTDMISTGSPEAMLSTFTATTAILPDESRM